MRLSLLLLALLASPAIAPGTADAKTCSGQAKSSLAACNTNNTNRPQAKKLDCQSLVQARLQACLQTGNWATSRQKSEVFEKR